MAIPLGTTSRQIEALARWALAGVIVLVMLAGWSPGYRSWGMTALGLMTVLVLWLLWRMMAAARTVPGHPVHWAFLGPVLILGCHLANSGVGRSQGEPRLVAGAINASMICQFGLLACGAMLAESLLPRAARRAWVLGACGAAMMAGPAAAILWGAPPTRTPAQSALAMLGFGGVGVWLSMPLGLRRGAAGGEPRQPPAPGPAAPRGEAPLSRAAWPAAACIALGAAAAAGLASIAPLQAVVAAAVAGAALVAAGALFVHRRLARLVAGGALLAAAVGLLAGVEWMRQAAAELLRRTAFAPWWGSGEGAFAELSAADSGLAVLVGMIGWPGAAWLIVGLGACGVRLMAHARRGGPGAQARAVLWTWACGCASAALLAPAGPFIPAVTLGAALVWGLLPAMTARPIRPRPGAMLLLGVIPLLLLMALVERPGLLLWSAEAMVPAPPLGRVDLVLHASAGLLLGLVAAWLMGPHRAWLGLAGIALAALAGGLGELGQHLAARYLHSGRTAEWADWLAHAAGSASAVVPYLLCRAARWCESPDAFVASEDQQGGNELTP